eukprot:scaffold105977_cov16-Tisochrysis_lutea.AAC.4
MLLCISIVAELHVQEGKQGPKCRTVERVGACSPCKQLERITKRDDQVPCKHSIQEAAMVPKGACLCGERNFECEEVAWSTYDASYLQLHGPCSLHRKLVGEIAEHELAAMG